MRYEGEGRRRRPIYADEGPSSAAARDPIAVHASGGLPHLGGPTGGAGPVERRRITALERALREEERPSPIAPRPAAARPSPAIQEEPTVTVTPPGEPEATPEPGTGPSAALSRLARAAQEAAAALEAKELADLSWRVASEALERAYQDVRLLGNPAADPFVEPLQPGPAVSEPTTDHAETIPVAAPQRAHTAAESRAAGTAGMLDARARAAALTGAAATKATNGADHPSAGGGSGQARPVGEPGAGTRGDRPPRRADQGRCRRARVQALPAGDLDADRHRQEGPAAHRADPEAARAVRAVPGLLT